MKDDIEPSLTQSKISAPETITKPETLSYKELMKIPYHTLKSVASYKNIALQNIQNKSQLCSQLKFVLTQQELSQYL